MDELMLPLLALLEQLASPNPLEQGDALCAALSEVGGAAGVALFGVGHGTALRLGGAGLPLAYRERFAPGTLTPQDALTGDLQQAWQSGEVVDVVGLEHDPRTASLASVAAEARYTSVRAIPLIHEGRPLGLLQAFFSGRIFPDRQKLLSRLAPSIGGVLHRAGSPSEALLLAARARTEHVHAVAARYGQPYAVAVYVLDRSDILRRRFGEPFVAMAGSALHDVVAENCRDADVFWTLEPEACLVVMPATRQDGAFQQAQRVLESFGRRVFRAGELRLQLSTSAGLSCFPENESPSARGSLRSAESALANALESHRQRLVAIAAPGAAKSIT